MALCRQNRYRHLVRQQSVCYDCILFVISLFNVRKGKSVIGRIRGCGVPNRGGVRGWFIWLQAMKLSARADTSWTLSRCFTTLLFVLEEPAVKRL